MTRAAFLVGAILATPVPESGAPGPVVTRDSFKYLDEDGEVRFAPSWEEVPEAYRSPLRWRHAPWCSEAPRIGVVEQTIELRDLDADGDEEVLVYFDDQCPNGRRFALLEVVESGTDGGFSIVASVNATRGFRPEPADLDGDGRLEIVGRHYGGAPELWVKESGEYAELIRGGSCLGTYWRLAMGKPGTPLEETLARVLELYRQGECRREWSPAEPAPDAESPDIARASVKGLAAGRGANISHRLSQGRRRELGWASAGPAASTSPERAGPYVVFGLSPEMTDEDLQRRYPASTHRHNFVRLSRSDTHDGIGSVSLFHAAGYDRVRIGFERGSRSRPSHAACGRVLAVLEEAFGEPAASRDHREGRMRGQAHTWSSGAHGLSLNCFQGEAGELFAEAIVSSSERSTD